MSVGRNTIDGKQLLGFVERAEAVAEDIKTLREDLKDIITEAERAGFSAKGVRFAMKVRAQKPREFEEAEQLRDMYLHAIGMADEPPLFRQIGAMAGEKLGRDTILERFSDAVPSGGEITLRLPGDALPVRIWRDADGKPHREVVEPNPAAPAPRRADVDSRPKPEPPPDVDEPGAEELGRQHARENKPIIANPFPFGDPRRARFDLGWRKETGNDGMGPDE